MTNEATVNVSITAEAGGTAITGYAITQQDVQPTAPEAWAGTAPPTYTITGLEGYSKLTMDYVTPHTPWARPNARGTLRGYCLIYTPNEGMMTNAREAIELMQRLDVKLDASYRYEFYSQHGFGGDGGERRVARLMANPYDVFIFHDMQPTKLPASALQNAQVPFLAKVRAGAGVVLIGADDGNLFKDAKVIADMPAYLAGTGAVKVMTLDKGASCRCPPVRRFLTGSAGRSSTTTGRRS